MRPGLDVLRRPGRAAQAVEGERFGCQASLRSLADEVRQGMAVIEEADLDRRRAGDRFAGPGTGRRDGFEVRGLVSEEGLGGCGSVEPLMWPQEAVVLEGEPQAAFEIGPQQRRSFACLRDGLEGSEEAVDECDRARFSDGAVAVAHATATECLPELLRRELRPLVGDGVSGWAEAAGGGAEETCDVAAARLGVEDARRERDSREDVENEGELEGEEAQEARDLGEIENPDVMREAGADGTAGGDRRRRRRRRGDRSFLADALNGSAGEPDARAGEMGRDGAVTREAGEHECLDQVAGHVAVAPNGRDWFEERADRRPLRLTERLLLPAQDGSQGHAKGTCGLLSGQGEQRLEAQDAVAGFGLVVRPLALGELVPTRAEDIEGLF